MYQKLLKSIQDSKKLKKVLEHANVKIINESTKNVQKKWNTIKFANEPNSEHES